MISNRRERTDRLPGTRPLVFVTVGSDHHRFDRLVGWVDSWAASRQGDVDCVIQHGPASPPQVALGVDYLPHDELVRLMESARVVVVQGGPMSIVESRSAGKLPIVTPRVARLNEVVDDHQVIFARRWASEGLLTLAEDEGALHAALDSLIDDPVRSVVTDNPKRDEQIARTVRRIGHIASDILRRTPGHGPDLVMIGGAGRSGSTLLERCLSEVPGVIGLGEVVHLWERGHRDDQLCGCGEPFSVCPFWTEVGAQAFSGWESVDPGTAVRDRAEVVRGRRIVSLVTGGVSPSWRLRKERILRRLDRLYEAAGTVGHARLVVDSSKHPAYGYLLRSASVRLRCVLVVRDPRGVAYSWSKSVRRPEVTGAESYMPRYSAARVTADWVSYRLLFQGLHFLGVPLLIVRYEDLVKNPRETIADVLRFCGVRPTHADLEHVQDDGALLSPHHTVAGNPMRFRTGQVAIRPDEEWRRELPLSRRLLVGSVTAPLRIWDRGHRWLGAASAQRQEKVKSR